MSTYTITISGSEREDGEKPYTYAVNVEPKANDPWADVAAAVGKALEIHAAYNELETPEDLAGLMVEEIFEGIPDEGCGYFWNDERAQ